MKRQKLEFRFHNPNTAEVTAEYIAQVIVEANQSRIERYLRQYEQHTKPIEAEDAAG